MLHCTRQWKHSSIAKVQINVYVYDVVMLVRAYARLHTSMGALARHKKL